MASGCDGPGWCVSRGTATQFEGSAVAGGSGATPMTVTIDDLDAQNQSHSSAPPSCQAAYAVRLGSSCVLWAQPGDFRYDTGKNASGDFIEATAALDGQGDCTLPLDGQPVAIAVRQGTLDLTPGRVQIAFDGYAQGADGGAQGAYVSVVYTGQ
jgi:hypothetical protein